MVLRIFAGMAISIVIIVAAAHLTLVGA